MKSSLTEKELNIFNDYACTDHDKERVAKDFGISVEYMDSIIKRGDEDIKNSETNMHDLFKQNK